VNEAQPDASSTAELGMNVLGRSQPGLLGRRQEHLLLTALVKAAQSGHGGSMVLRGDIGVGKSALLEEVTGEAGNFRVSRFCCAPSERDVAFSALQQFCAPLTATLAELPLAQRNALSAALGLADDPPLDQFLVGMAVLGLVRESARRKPTLWIVDDAQWLDRESRNAIGFAGRRLRGSAAVLLVATRDESEGDDDFDGFEEVRLTGLGASDASTLFDSVVMGPIDPAVRNRILAESRGNPLALLELPKTWTTAEFVEGLSEPTWGSVADQLEQGYARQIRDLPYCTQTFLTLAAAETTGDAALVQRAAITLELDWAVAAPAERVGLVDLGPLVRFSHPLARAAAYRVATLQTRLQVHRALAEMTDPGLNADRRAWHRANSTVVHDETIASELERSAGQAQARSGLPAAAALLERSALLTPHGGERADRTLAAASAQREAGALDPALRLLLAVSSGPASGLRDVLTDRLRGRLASDQHRHATAAEVLLYAAQSLEGVNPLLARETHLEALLSAVEASGPRGNEFLIKAAEAAISALASRTEHVGVNDLLLAALALRVTEGHETAATLLRRALVDLRDGDGDVDRTEPTSWATRTRSAEIIAIETWDLETGILMAERGIAAAKASGAAVHLQAALSGLATHLVLAGELRSASALVKEEMVLSRRTGVSSTARAELLLAAYRGDTTSSSLNMRAKAEPTAIDEQGQSVAFARYASSVLHNGIGCHAEALQSARDVFEWHPLGYETLAAAELAEAASRTGETAVLHHVRGWMSARAAATPTRWSLGIAARVEALESEGDAAEFSYRASIEHLKRTCLRSELGRSHLLYGEWLRRNGHRGKARHQLSVALETLNEIGASGFAERAHRELAAATNRRMRRYVDAPELGLTSQEMRIAQLVQQGLTNPEIGARLFLSPRTIEWHLRNIFGKFGISSRRELRVKNLDTNV
jgi:DNA-binding CsgD family transcriptional regulator